MKIKPVQEGLQMFPLGLLIMLQERYRLGYIMIQFLGDWFCFFPGRHKILTYIRFLIFASVF